MKKLVVLGGGISGYGSAILARRKGIRRLSVRQRPHRRPLPDETRSMGRALRGGRPQRGAHPRRFGMRQVARHPRLGAHRAQTSRTGRSRDLRDRIRGALSRRCAHDLHHRFERQDDHHVARLPDSARRGLQRRPGRQHRRKLRPIRSQPAGTIGMCWNSARSSWTACSGSGPTSVC